MNKSESVSVDKTRNFVFDRSALEICKMAAKSQSSGTPLPELVWLNPNGIVNYSDGYLLISYRLPDKKEGSTQSRLFEKLHEQKDSKILKSVAFYGKEMANILNLKSDMEDVGQEAIVRTSEKGGLDVFWDSGLAEVKYHIVEATINRPAFEAMHADQEVQEQNGSRMLFDSGILEKAIKIIHKIQKRKDDKQIMINNYKDKGRIEFTSDGLSVVVMGLKMNNKND